MSTTVLLEDNVSVLTGKHVTKAFALNYILNNGGAMTLDAEVQLVLVQDVGGVGETSTIFQSWKQFNIPAGEYAYYHGTYFLTEADIDQVTEFLNPPIDQKYQIVLIITGGDSPNRSLFGSTANPNATELSTY